MRNGVLLIAAILALVSSAACGGAKKDEVKDPSSASSAQAPRAAFTPDQEQALDKAEAETGAQGLSIDEQILKLCPTVRPPEFDYDSSKVKTRFRSTIGELAECMKTGGLKDRDVLLVGHADPRGEDDYNMSLGGQRASAVRGAIMSFGIEQRRIDVSSRGALDATGTDEAGWAKDRRVDIKLKM